MTGIAASFEARFPADDGSTANLRATAAPGSVPAQGPADAFAPRLAGWFDWTHAIELAAALGGVEAPGVTSSSRSTTVVDPRRLAQDVREIERVRTLLTRRVIEATADADEPSGRAALATGRNPPDATGTPLSDGTAHASSRRRHAACQHGMDTEIRKLRQRLRATLSAGPPRLARLAEVDAVMEQVIGARERVAWAATAERLAARFEAPRVTHDAGPREAPPLPELPQFRQEMRALLLAELEARLQPSRGLLAAGRAGLHAATHG